MDKEQIISELLKEPFYVKTSKGNFLACNKIDGKWIAQGNEVKRPQDIEYLEKEYEKNKKDMVKTLNNTMDELEYGLWDSGNLSISQQKILDLLMEQGVAKRTPGVPGEHDTANGTARWIYTLNINEDIDREQLHNRLNNKDKSKQTELAWKRHHASYMRGTRERERNTMNKTFYGVAKELEEMMSEAAMTQDNRVDNELDITFNNISGGIGVNIDDKTGNVSLSVQLKETGAGNYRTDATDPATLDTLYKNLKDDLLNLARNFDEEVAQMITRYGLKSTK